MIGSHFLPPSIDLAIRRERLMIAPEFMVDQSQSVFLVGDLSLRMISLTGDSARDSRNPTVAHNKGEGFF